MAPRRSGRLVAVTFDDAFASVADRAKPVMDALGLPGTVFAVTSFAERGGPLSWDGIDHWADTPFAGELAGLDWARMRELAGSGWEVGSHTVTHPRLTQCPEARLAGELRESREACEHALGGPCRSLAYPYGDVDGRVVAAAAEAGYATAATLPRRWVTPAPLAWPRVGVWHHDDPRRFAIKTSFALRRLRRALDPVLGRT
jgi:peptidoglycan/xylan/chitin deacetylase (PgdA/CDA1 family)